MRGIVRQYGARATPRYPPRSGIVTISADPIRNKWFTSCDDPIHMVHYGLEDGPQGSAGTRRLRAGRCGGARRARLGLAAAPRDAVRWRRWPIARAASVRRATAAGCRSTSRGGCGPIACARTCRSRPSSPSRTLPAADPEPALRALGVELVALVEQDVDRAAVGPGGRDGTPPLWQAALRVPEGTSLLPHWMALERAGVHVASLSRSSCVYKVLRRSVAAAAVRRRPRASAVRDAGGDRPQPLLDQHAARLRARAAVRAPRPQRRDQHHPAAAAGAARPGGAAAARSQRHPGPGPAGGRAARPRAGAGRGAGDAAAAGAAARPARPLPPRRVRAAGAGPGRADRPQRGAGGGRRRPARVAPAVAAADAR